MTQKPTSPAGGSDWKHYSVRLSRTAWGEGHGPAHGSASQDTLDLASLPHVYFCKNPLRSYNLVGPGSHVDFKLMPKPTKSLT